MPKFLDHHQTPMSPEGQQMVREKINAGGIDEYGSTGINVLFTDSETWCLTDAPGPEAVHKAHEAIGVKLGAGDINEISSVVPL